MVDAAVAGAVAIDAINIYWVGLPNKAIYMLPQTLPGGVLPFTVADPMGQPITGLASDGTNVYFGTSSVGASSGGAGSLYYVPIGGGPPTVMYTTPNTSRSALRPVVTAGGAVFWVDKHSDPDAGMGAWQYTIMGIAAP
jgi:hypothetical protein